MRMKKWLLGLAIVVGLLAFAAIVWFGGPLIGYERHPAVRSGLGTACHHRRRLRRSSAASTASTTGGRRQAAKALEAALAESEGKQGDGKVLGERMTEALETLKRSSGKRNYLYDLPWYVIIGPPGAGKTTALVNSGLKFPLAGADGGKAIAGVGGTRYCDWWFTEEAVLIDTAGRYTTQDSDAEADKKSWLSFLSLLKTQPRQAADQRRDPRDQPRGPAEARRRRSSPPMPDAIRKRLLELHEQLQDRFPGLCAVHQGRPDRRLHGVFRQLHRGAPPQGLGRDLPDRGPQEEHGRRGAGRVRSPGAPPDRGGRRPAAGGARSDRAHRDLRLPGAVRRCSRTASPTSSTASSSRRAIR